MTEQEQTALFKRIQKKFPRRSRRWCSGYVHGILDEGLLSEPHLIFLDAYDRKEKYHVGYVNGFMDARGPDVHSEKWYRNNPQVDPHRRALNFQWWVKK